ncbi:hypothetical protein APHAL10511_001738 [Amanita phalloides]|nr:hypothetical protein APHAL10511_001738 [Amanita phalloides]
MRAVLACVLAFTSSTLAYSVSSPNDSKGWTNVGPQYLEWSRVNTDPANFTVVLTNTDTSVMPHGGQVLAALVDGSMGNTTLNPPNLGWPLGSGFRINLAKDAHDLDTLLAQSGQFSIKPPVVSSSSGSSSLSSSYVVGTTSSVYVARTTMAATTAGNSSPSSTPTKSSGSSNGALPHSHVNAALWGILGTIGFFLA